MATKAGERMKFEGATAEVVVTKGGEGDVTFDAAATGALQIGKRYQSATTGIEVLVTKAGSGQLVCNGEEMAQVQPKQTKSAD